MEQVRTGRIYCLRSFQTDKIYIGSTTSKLIYRLTKHKNDYKRYLNNQFNYISSYDVIKYNDCYIELIKEVICSKRQLLILEGEEMKIHSNVTNIRKAGNYAQYKTKEEYHKTHREEYYKKNKKHINEKSRMNYRKQNLIVRNDKNEARRMVNHRYYINRKNKIQNNNINGTGQENLKQETQQQEIL